MKEEDEEDCDETGPSHGWKKEEAQLIKEVNTWNNLHVLPYQNWIQVYMLPLLTPLTPPSPLTYTGTNINSETGDPGSLHSSAALLPTWFPEPPFYTCLRLKWGSRDKILQKLFLAADRNEARVQAWEVTVKFPFRNKNWEKKNGTPVPISWFSDTLHRLIWKHNFFSSSFTYICMGALLELNYWDLGRNYVYFIGTSWHLT